MARRGVKKSTKRARKTSGARKVRARKRAGARKSTGSRKSSARRTARKTSARGKTRKQTARSKKAAPRRARTAAPVPQAASSVAGTMGGGGRDRDELTLTSEDFMTTPELEDVGGMSDEDLDR